MRHRGIIIEKTAQDVLVQIEDPAKTCGSCKGCMRLLPAQSSNEYYVVRTKDPGDKYQVGDEVILDSQMRPYVRALGVLYVLPFGGLFAGYGLGRFLSGSDTVGGVWAIAALLVGATIARFITRRMLKGDPEFTIVARACS